jgi:uncharacterized protein
LSVEAAIRAELEAFGSDRLRPFDVHTHTGVDVDGSTRSCEESARDSEAVGGRAVIFPLCVTSGYETENRRVIEECQRHPDLLVPFARLDPRVSGARAAAAALAAGARGVKLHPRSEAFALDHPNVEAILAVAAAERVPVLIHAGVGVGAFGETLLGLAARNRGCQLILAHAGVSDLTWLWRELPQHPNVYFDTAWWNPADLLALFALVPPGRILFGSDAPYMGVELLLTLCLRCARHAGLSAEAIALVAGGQLQALLAGDDPHDAGPAPGALAAPLPPNEARLVSLLYAAGGCMLGGGDPSQSLELAALAAASETARGDGPLSVDELIEVARTPAPEAIPALGLALVKVMTPSVGRASAVA